MRIQFLSDGSEFRSYGGGNFSKTKGDGSIYWWTIFITFLMILATACWLGPIVAFAYPEKPFSYRLLTKLKKLEPIRGYSKLSVPHGKFYEPAALLSAYFYHSPKELRDTNDQLKRNYIKNFKDQPPAYVSGTFSVIGIRQLTAADVFTSGWVVVLRSTKIEDVDVELVLPGATSEAPPYQVGGEVVLDTNTKKSSFANVVHVEKIRPDRLSVTVVPIVYEEFATGEGTALALVPPTALNMEAAWPIARDIKTPSPDEAPAPQTEPKVAAQ
jgi:hypothetical protein